MAPPGVLSLQIARKYVWTEDKTREVFLELGNGEKFLSRGVTPDVPIVTAGLTIKIELTVTNRLKEVDLVLGMNWLQLVNPVVDWGNGKLHVPKCLTAGFLVGRSRAGRNNYCFAHRKGTLKVQGREE